uniref:DNA 3'-5' helicase n=1 Tax=Rhizophagus irregularis (strain DAOM 181602 / DAOM 197198 / MUCL 43194) TaxID=747089 RepID=U9TP61_RHIID
MYKPIIDSAKFSSEMLLREILDHLELTHLPGQEKMLPIGFDCSWSHSRNAHQASGEFLYLGDLPGYNYQPVIGFYTVENSRVIRKSENDSSAIIYKGNFDGTSRKMEHAILLALLNDIMPILEQTDFTLHVCVDGDLETNRTLACIPAVSRIFADLKHVSKNIRKNLLKKQYSRWHPFEQHIMRYFNSCIFSAGLKNKLNQNSAPTEEETRHVQVEGLIRHLLDDHSLCWDDVCWIKDNPELQLQNPTLKNYTQAEIENFRSFITTIFRIPSGQGLVTTFRTSHNETFNRKILKYLDKRIDYWASYSTRHALAVLDQNDGLDVMISKVRAAATEKDFSYSDICNILNFVKERSQNVLKNRSTIQQRNEARKEKFANDRKELAGFDFDKELVSYKSKTPEQIRKDIFWPSFGDILRDFDVIVKCVACHAFAKKSARGLCGLCSFYVDAGLWGRIINDKFIPKGQLPEPLKIDTLISLAAKKIFGFDNFRDGQMEAIITYLGGKDTFVSMKTGGGKTLCYALSAICFEGLTIVFSPLKALMDDQKRELISAGIPCATIYANLAQGASIQEKIFEEIACGLIKILFITPEKLTSNGGFCKFITQLYEQKKVRFIIDEAHCILAYQDFREAWGQLGMLKQRWKMAPIMLLTATCTRMEVNEICKNLIIEENNFALIRGSTSHRSEIIFNVKERKEIRDQYITEIISILQESLNNISINYFHGGLCDNERETAMNNWKTNYTQIMIATSAFGMGINSSNVRVVIHVEVPMTSLIQEAGRAGRDGNTATHFIFYGKKDIRTNYSIIAEYRETASIIANIEQRLINKLERATKKIFEVFYYCNSQYECRQQLIWRYQAWPNEQKPPTCEICDNCINRIADKPKLLDGKEEIIKLIEVVEYLTQMGEQIGPDDVVDIFRGGKTAKIKQKNWNTLPVYPTEKRKVLKTKDLVHFALTDLVVRGLVQEDIILRKPIESSKVLSSNIIIKGVVPGIQASANMQTWLYFVK